MRPLTRQRLVHAWIAVAALLFGVLGPTLQGLACSMTMPAAHAVIAAPEDQCEAGVAMAFPGERVEKDMPGIAHADRDGHCACCMHVDAAAPPMRAPSAAGVATWTGLNHPLPHRQIQFSLRNWRAAYPRAPPSPAPGYATFF